MNGILGGIAKKVGLTSAQVVAKHLDDAGGILKGKTKAATAAITRATSRVDSALTGVDKDLAIRNGAIRELQMRKGAAVAGGATAGVAGLKAVQSRRAQAKMQNQAPQPMPMSSYQGPMQPGVGSGRYA